VNVLVAVITLALLALVVYVVSAPLRGRLGHGRAPGPPESDEPPASEPDVARGAPDAGELEVERDGKYREIRDAELDYRTGKLSPEDYAAIDAELRREAIDILHRLDRARGAAEPPGLRPRGASGGRSRSRRTAPRRRSSSG
jgi:hypothetical protein